MLTSQRANTTKDLIITKHSGIRMFERNIPRDVFSLIVNKFQKQVSLEGEVVILTTFSERKTCLIIQIETDEIILKTVWSCVDGIFHAKDHAKLFYADFNYRGELVIEQLNKTEFQNKCTN